MLSVGRRSISFRKDDAPHPLFVPKAVPLVPRRTRGTFQDVGSSAVSSQRSSLEPSRPLPSLCCSIFRIRSEGL